MITDYPESISHISLAYIFNRFVGRIMRKCGEELWMRKLEDDLRNYYSDIKKILNCKAKIKVKFINDLSEHIDIYVQDHPNAMIEEITTDFGTPEEIAEGFLLSMDDKDKQEYWTRHRIFRRFVISCIVITVIAIIGVYIFNYLYVKESTATIIYKTTIESEE